MEFSEVPRTARWTVRDDPDDTWRATLGDRNTRTWTVDWRWAEGYTDGGVLRGGLDGDASIQVAPEFGGAGGIDDWQVLSGSAADPNRTALDTDRSIALRTGTC